MRIPTGREWRRRWARLEDRERRHIVDTVRTGGTLRELRWAELAVTYARSRWRDTVGVVLIGPGLLLAALLLGASLGRAGRGDDAGAVAWELLTLGAGLPWLVAWAVGSLAMLLITRRWRARLREAEEGNLERLRQRPPRGAPRGTRRSPRGYRR